jgi:hypothetical protein
MIYESGGGSGIRTHGSVRTKSFGSSVMTHDERQSANWVFCMIAAAEGSFGSYVLSGAYDLAACSAAEQRKIGA